ncbi:hypothetical protein CIPAW_08G171200 [Carya illinoinensis]|uniref:Secreted protein n=1 Tax=Carya illinoinensis TaxID=32201 RepID=A0A8T1PPI1_CARIL|nr:hypothetical protein CIPAW_08G171200 [Carya illinoinensis]
MFFALSLSLFLSVTIFPHRFFPLSFLHVEKSDLLGCFLQHLAQRSAPFRFVSSPNFCNPRSIFRFFFLFVCLFCFVLRWSRG